MLAPTQIIKIGPSDTLGREFKIVKYGSITFDINLLYQRIIAINIPKIVPRRKLITVSYDVIHIWRNKSLDLYNDFMEDNKEYTDYGYCNDNSLLLRDDFDNLIEDIKRVYISKTYIGLMSWLIDRAFLISQQVKNHNHLSERKTNENKALLLKVLYDINAKNVLQIFSKHS